MLSACDGRHRDGIQQSGVHRCGPSARRDLNHQHALPARWADHGPGDGAITRHLGRGRAVGVLVDAAQLMRDDGLVGKGKCKVIAVGIGIVVGTVRVAEAAVVEANMGPKEKVSETGSV